MAEETKISVQDFISQFTTLHNENKALIFTAFV